MNINKSYTLKTQHTTEGLPLLILAADTNLAPAPTVLVMHGLGRSKEHMLPALYAFAQAGFRAVGIDARLHGARLHADRRDDLLQTDYIPTLYEMIAGSARDLPQVLDTLEVEQVAVHGVSLGGYIAFAGMVHEPRITVATVAMGSPDWLEAVRALGFGPGHGAYDLAAAGNPLDRAAETYPPRALLMLHGDQDDVVSVNGVRSLFERLQPSYMDNPERLELTLYPGLGHQYTDEMLARSIAWTQRFLC